MLINNWYIESSCHELIVTTSISKRLKKDFDGIRIVLLTDIATRTFRKLIIDDGIKQIIKFIKNDEIIIGEPYQFLIQQSDVLMTWLREVGFVRTNYGFMELN